MSTPWDWTNHAAGPLSPPICRLFALKLVHLKTNQGKLQPVFQNATSTRPVDMILFWKFELVSKMHRRNRSWHRFPLPPIHLSRNAPLAGGTDGPSTCPWFFWPNYHEGWYEPLMIHFISPNMSSPKQTVSCLQFNKTFGVGLRARLGGETCYFQARYWISSGNLPFPATVKNSATTFCLVRNP